MKILLVRVDRIGDLVLTTPLIRSLALSGHYVDALVRASTKDVLLQNPFIVERFTLEEIVPQFPKNWMLLAKWIRSRAYDAIILPYANPKALLFASFLSGVKLRVAMWSGIWGRLTFHKCLRSGVKKGRRHLSDMILDCARVLDISTHGMRPDFFLSDAEKNAARKEMEERFFGLKIVGIHPGCSGNTCNLHSKEYGELALKLIEMKNIAVVGTGIASETHLFEAWPLKVLNHSRFYNACGKWTLRELAARMSTFSIMVAVGTGPLHIANALELKTVSPFCAFPALSAVVWGNPTPKSIAISPHAEYCLLRRKHTYTHCDFGGQISVDDIFSAVINCMGTSCKKTDA